MANTLIKTAIAASAAMIGLLSSAAHAAEGYATDSQASTTKNTYGECWRTGTWTKENATEECDANLLPPKAVPVAVTEPGPVVAAPVVASGPKYEKITYKAEALFAFNSAKLSNNGKTELEKLADQIKGEAAQRTDDQIVVVGHADRIGKVPYNQKLSEARAKTVRDYAIAKGVAPEKIRAEGRGKAEPVTADNDCAKFKKSRKKLIQCYAPDRRVEIFVPAKKELVQ